MKKLLLMLAILIISSCSPSFKKMQLDVANFKLPQLPNEKKALIYVIRPEYMGTLVKFDVSVDKNPIGYTRGGQYIYFDVTPGEHDISSEAENTANYKVIVKMGDIIFIHQKPTMGFLYARNNLSQFNETEGKYYLKNTKLGHINQKN